jgi:hypothetical protein
MNSTGGAVAYGWRPVAGSGMASVALGNDGLEREEVYDGFAGSGPQHLAADADWAHSEGNGTVPFGDFHFDRADARVEWVSQGTQTDLFAGYQASFFGWPDLYTPFDSDETENLQTVLIAATPGRTLAAAISYRGASFTAATRTTTRLTASRPSASSIPTSTRPGNTALRPTGGPSYGECS